MKFASVMGQMRWVWIAMLGVAVWLYACAGVSPTALPRTETTIPFTATPDQSQSPTAIPSTPNPGFVSALLGLWQGNNSSFYSFKKDGTWAWAEQQAQVGTSPARQGTWWIEGTVLNLVDSGAQAPCPQTQVGTYQMDYKNGVLLLGKLTDRCKARGLITQGMYHQLQKGQ